MPLLGRVGYKLIDLGIAVSEIAKGTTPSPPPTPPPSPSRAATPTSPLASPSGSPSIMHMRSRSLRGTAICTGIVELQALRGTALFMSPEQLDPEREVGPCVWWVVA